MNDELVGGLGRWMIFVAGIAILVSTIILPANADLRATRIQRDLALHLEQAQLDRIDRFGIFYTQLKNPDQSTIELLARSQLGMIPQSSSALIMPGQPADPQLFEFLEPVPIEFVPQSYAISRLEELSTNQHSRLWIGLIGAIAILYGILPPSKLS